MNKLKDLITEFHTLKSLYLESSHDGDVGQAEYLMHQMEAVAVLIDTAAAERAE